MSARFHVPDAKLHPGALVSLPTEEATHAARVLRVRVGDEVGVFDGRGREGRGVVETTGPGVHVRVRAVEETGSEWTVAVTVVHAVLKGDKMDDVVRDVVMMGAVRLVPLVTARSEVARTAVALRARVERWRRIAVASAKQCGRAVVPHIAEVAVPTAAGQWLETYEVPHPRLLLVEPGAALLCRPIGRIPRPSSRAASVLVGPEGGWSPEELTALTASALPVTLGPRTLRADATATVALAALSAVWGEDGDGSPQDSLL